MDIDGTEVTVQVNDDAELEGDILSLEAQAEALDAGELVDVGVEGTLSADRWTKTACWWRPR